MINNKEEIKEIDFQFANKEEHYKEENFEFKRWSKLKIFLNKKTSVIALIILIILTVLAIIGPFFNEYTYYDQNLDNSNFAPRIQFLEFLGIFDGTEHMKTSTGSKEINKYIIDSSTNEKIDKYFWFGTDTLGRDIFTRTWQGTRISLFIALVAVLIDMIIGITYGMISGFCGGKVDFIMQRIAEIIYSIPTLVTVTLFMLVLTPGFTTIILALMVRGWVGMARITRAQVLKVKEQDYIKASKTLGTSNIVIIFKEIIPNIMGQLITNIMFSIPDAIFTEAFLGFVGLGVPEPMPSLGSLISYAYQCFTTHPYQIVPPVIVLGLLMLCFNILADGIRDVLDPKSVR